MRGITAPLSLLCVLAVATPSAAERPTSAIRYGQDLLGDDDGQLAPRRTGRTRRSRRRHRAIERRRRRLRQRAPRRRRRHRRRAPRAEPVPTTARSAAHAKVAERARALVGVSLASDAALLGRALGHNVDTAAIKGALAELGAARRHRRQLRPGDVVAFRLRGAQRLLAVVVARRGARVRFVYRFAGSGRLGVLHARQPNRRRLPSERVVANTYLRPVRVGESPKTPRLAGQLLEGVLTL